MDSVRLADWTWVEIATARPTLLVPLGSTEQHGPHLPLSVDSSIAERVATDAATEVAVASEAVGVLVAPTLHYGASGEHGDFAGTLSIGTEALTSVLVELARSADHFSRIVFVCGHGGNSKAIGDAVGILRSESRDASVFYCAVGGADPHAGHTETSVMSHIAPDSVRSDRVEPGNDDPWTDIGAQAIAGGIKSVSPNGVLGDPTTADPNLGEAYLAEMVSSLISSLGR